MWSLAVPHGSTGIAYCFGDGSSLACPCSNSSAVGNQSGCLNAIGTGGNLVSSGTESLSADSLVFSASGMPASGGGLYFQGTQKIAGGLGTVFGDGLLCVTGSIVRLAVKFNVAGQSTYPGSGEPSVSIQGAVSEVGQRMYQVWYRDSATFCSGSTFNLTNGVDILWTP
jgi:hypothetical protein